MKYLVMETHPAYTVLLDESGRFLKAANLHYQVGDTVQDIIELRPPQTRRRSFGRPLAGIAGLAACLCLAFFGYYQPNFMAYGTLRIQINPDVEMTVSRTERAERGRPGSDCGLFLSGENPGNGHRRAGGARHRDGLSV